MKRYKCLSYYNSLLLQGKVKREGIELRINRDNSLSLSFYLSVFYLIDVQFNSLNRKLVKLIR